MRTMLIAAALVVFAVSTGLLEMGKTRHRPMTSLPPAMGEFGQSKVDAISVTSILVR